MWPFGRKTGLHTNLRKFSDFVPPEELDKILENPTHIPEFERKAIDFIIIQVRDDELEQTRRNLNKVVSVATNCGGVVDSVLSPVILVTFPDIEKVGGRIGAEQRTQTVHQLSGELGVNAKGIHGCGDGLYGLIGTDRRFVHGAIITDFARLMRMLLELNFGAFTEA